MITLSYGPGQTVLFYLQVVDANGVASDGYTVPVADKVILPGLTASSAYPISMTKYDTGLYYHSFVLPSGSSAVGTYLVSVSYVEPSGTYTKTEVYQIVVSAPFGQYSVSPG